MGNFTVCHLDQVKGDGGGLGSEIKRQRSDGSWHAKDNVDRSRSHLNRVLKGTGDPSLKGGNFIASAIDRRIKDAGVSRKISKNQSRAIVAYLSGSHDQMMEIVRAGMLDEWCDANMRWLEDTFGKDNVVSVDLHMDEFTPHLHAVIVPIRTEPRFRNKREGKAKYNVKPKVRLAASDICRKPSYIHIQDTYSDAMAPFDLERGVHGSKARHQSMNEYYRDLKAVKIPEAESRLSSLDKEIGDIKAEIPKVESRLSSLDKEIVLKSNDLDKIKAEIGRLMPELQKSQKAAKSLTTQIANLEAQLRDADSKVCDSVCELHSAELKRDQRQREIGAIEANIERKKGILAEKETFIAEKTKEITLLQERIDALSNQRDSMEVEAAEAEDSAIMLFEQSQTFRMAVEAANALPDCKEPAIDEVMEWFSMDDLVMLSSGRNSYLNCPGDSHLHIDHGERIYTRQTYWWLKVESERRSKAEFVRYRKISDKTLIDEYKKYKNFDDHAPKDTLLERICAAYTALRPRHIETFVKLITAAGCALFGWDRHTAYIINRDLSDLFNLRIGDIALRHLGLGR